MKQNKEIAQELILHLKLGKPLTNRSRKPIGNRTAAKYKIWLDKFDKWFGKNFYDLSQEDIDNFRKGLMEDEIRREDGKPYKTSTKMDIEDKFLKPLLMFVNKPEQARYICTYKENVEIPALTKEEVEKIITQSKLRDKLIFQLLFDGGFRAEEFLNVKFSDIKDDLLAKDGYYKIRITKSKTLPRTVGLTLPLSTEILREWLDMNKDKIGTTKPLIISNEFGNKGGDRRSKNFKDEQNSSSEAYELKEKKNTLRNPIPLTHKHLGMIMKRLGDRVLNKKINPHLLRHSSATYYCHLLNQYQMCKRYGWSMGSNMPRRYIDREGIDEETINHKVVESETLSFRKQVNALQEQLNRRNEEFNAMQKEQERANRILGRIQEVMEKNPSFKEDFAVKARDLG